MAETLSNAEALQQVIQKAKRTRHLSKGLNECARALEQRKAVLCVLSSGVAEAAYSSLITALCQEHQVPLMKVDDSELLGTWAGLATLDEEGNTRKVVKCGCVVVNQWSGADAASATIQNFIKTL